MQNVLSNSEPYAPSDDTIFFANYIRNETGNCALDIGTGSGYLAKILLRGFNFVVATDYGYAVPSGQGDDDAVGWIPVKGSR